MPEAAMARRADGNWTRVCNFTDVDCVHPEFLHADRYKLAVYGYVMPGLVFLTVITNCLVCAVLLRRSMRTPTNVLLVAMAISDMLTGLSTMPAFIKFFTLGAYVDYMPYDWCLVYNWFTDYIPTVFHTTSIWLTVTLAAQRYLYVCHSIIAKRFCTVNNIVKVIVGVYVAALLSQLTRFVEMRAERLELKSYVNPNTTIIGCQLDFAAFFEAHQHAIFNVYFWFRVVFVHFIPCSALVLLNAALSCAMQRAKRRRQQLLKLNRRQECLRLQESNSTTLMLVVVVSLFLLVELPVGVHMSVVIVENTANTPLVDEDTNTRLQLFLNLVILLSYPLNFFIYCAMSRRFRTEFCRTLRPWRRYDNSVLLTTEPAGTGLPPPPVNGCGGRRATAEMRRDNSAAYIALSAVVVRQEADDAPALITDNNGDDDDVAEVQL